MFDRFRALTIRQQIVSIAAAVAAMSVVLVAVWYFALRTTYEPLFAELRPSDAATIVADLERKKIPYKLEKDGTTILVPADAVEGTRLAVMTEDLPLKGTVGFELFNKTDMGLTDFAQKINYQRALQGELERTIMTLDGVDSARVHLSLGEDRIFRDDRVPPKASVTIRMQRNATLPANAAQGIQRLIAAAVPNLDVSDVVLLDEKGRLVGAPLHVEPLPGTGSPLLQEKRAIEQYYEALVRQALDRAYPQEDIAVAVTANPGAPDTASLPDWNPSARTFPLEVSLEASMPFDAASQKTLRGLVESVLQSDPAKNDTVVFGIAARTAESQPAPAMHSVPPAHMVEIPVPAPYEDGRNDWIAAAVMAGTMVVILGVFFILVLRLRRPRRLTPEQRADFAVKLRSALNQGESRAISR